MILIGDYKKVGFTTIDELKEFVDKGIGDAFFYSVYDDKIYTINNEIDIEDIGAENELEHTYAYIDSRFL